MIFQPWSYHHISVFHSFSKMLEMHLLSKTCWGSTLRAAAALASQLIMKPIWNLNGFQSNRTILQTQSSPTFKLSWQTWYSKRLCPELLECEPKIFRCPIYNWENTMIASTHLSFWYMSSCCWLKQAPLKWPIHPVLHIVLADGSFNSFSVSWDSYICSDWIEKCFNMFHIDHLSLYIYIFFNIYYIYNIYSIYILYRFQKEYLMAQGQVSASLRGWKVTFSPFFSKATWVAGDRAIPCSDR